ncbi:MAG: FAD-binding oxidoreductase [Pseudomonadota bacterium]
MPTLVLPLQRPPDAPVPPTITDPERLEAVVRDAAGVRGRATGLVEPRDEAQLCAWLRACPDTPVLAQGALTSLTGGATPAGDGVLSTRRMNHLRIDGAAMRAVAGPGLLLADLHAALAERSLYYPPAPTHDGASLGGNAATNAAGAATFAYGTTRDWVRRLRVALRHGEVLELRRGEHQIRPGDTLELVGERSLRAPVPTHPSPPLKKTSAGYHTRDPMDPIDLFLGAEGTLGIITEVEIALLPRPTALTALVFLPGDAQALALSGTLRERSAATRAGARPGGLAVRSIEYFDRRCLDLIAAGGALDDLRVRLPEDAGACLLLVQELTPGADDASVLADLEANRGPIADLVDALALHGALDTTELALPEQTTRQAQLAAVREAIPLAVSEWMLAQQRADPGVHKVGGDMIVPFAHLPAMLAAYRAAFRACGLDHCVYGHISDGNLHPNGLPVCAADVAAAEATLLTLASQAIALGGCPLSEHGVGRSPLKQRMLALARGPAAIAEMKALKAALDPGWTLARGVLFPPPDKVTSPW